MWTLYLSLVPYIYHTDKVLQKGLIARSWDIHSTDIYNWGNQSPFTHNWKKRHFQGLYLLACFKSLC